MFSRTSEYALRSTIYLAQHAADWPIPGRCIAEQVGIPAKYLGKVLTDLVRARVLDASPGKTGGYWLRRTARQTSLYDVVAPFEAFDRERCAFGNQDCGDKNPCLAHKGWQKVVDVQRRFLKQTSIFAVAVGDPGAPGPRRRRRAPQRRRRGAK